MIDTDRSIFHWDHYVTVKEMQRELLSLQQTGSATERRVRSVLAKASVAWILKSEDRALNRRGYKEDLSQSIGCVPASRDQDHGGAPASLVVVARC